LHKCKITYREVKLMQHKDLQSGASQYYIYRHFSSPFTWAFIRLGVSPNKITISSFFLCLIGLFFLLKGTYLYLLLGLLFFIMFKIMDMSDGEVARIVDKKSAEGLYFDRLSHYIFSCCLGFGLGFGLYNLYHNDTYILLGFIFTFVFLIENAVQDLLKLVAREKIMGKKTPKKLAGLYKEDLDRWITKHIMDSMFKGRSWSKSSIFSKIVGIYPYQGIIYTDTFTILILAVLAAGEYYLSFTNLTAYGYTIKLIPLYLVVVSLSKIIWIVTFLSKMEQHRYLTDFLNKV
jgi:phosphatidylglycerophosphate synthase